ncbi:hypothetical protein B0H14DRAFT_3487322 [Mycena olivaceomarginata]|nr:hypothetical protein B0H14DRAFT_3487322 [Mycena olivaceomarginata]
MKLSLLLMTLLLSALAANSFAGANIYYLYALPTANCIAILNDMQAAGMKVLHTWATGVGAGQKASNNIAGIHDKNALQSGDIHAQTYSVNGFYTNPGALRSFNERITHILNIHKNVLLGNQPWRFFGAYIFGLEPQNELHI